MWYLKIMQQKNIILIGKSEKFYSLIKSIYPKSSIEVLSWRKILKKNNEYSSKRKNESLIFVNGYHYGGSYFFFKKYYEANVTRPFNLIKRISNSKTKIIYFNTANNISSKNVSKNLITFSRYEFAKKELAFKLFNFSQNLLILDIPVIKNHKNKPLIFGDKISQLIFYIMIKLNLVNSIKISDLKVLIKRNIKNKTKSKPIRLKKIGLFIPRTLFIDRLLRMING